MMNVTLLGYIDPGSGFILLQIIMAGVVGTGIYFRRMFWRVSRVFGRGSAEQSGPESVPPTDPQS